MRKEKEEIFKRRAVEKNYLKAARVGQSRRRPPSHRGLVTCYWPKGKKWDVPKYPSISNSSSKLLMKPWQFKLVEYTFTPILVNKEIHTVKFCLISPHSHLFSPLRRKGKASHLYFVISVCFYITWFFCSARSIKGIYPKASQDD